MRLRHRLALLVLVAVVAPSCGDDTPTLPDVVRSVIQVVVEPNPVPASQNPLTGAVSAGYRITIAELAGLGGQVLFVSSTVFDPESGQQVALNYFDDKDLVVFVGSDRVEPLGTLEVPQTVSYLLPDFRTDADLTVSVQVRDDRGNLLNQSLLVKIQLPQ